MLALSLAARDPMPTWAANLCCDAQHGSQSLASVGAFSLQGS